MKIAIIGSGISGLTAAYRLHQHHDVTVFEANDYLGGHTHTVDVNVDGRAWGIDTGFIVFNYATYPQFTALLRELDVASQPTTMGFSVRCDRTGLEYAGTSLNGLFAQRTNLVRPAFYRLMSDWWRFNQQSPELLQSNQESLTVGEYLRRERYSRAFIEQYFLPMGSAVWSCPTGVFEEFPVRFIVEFYRNHGLLGIFGRPQWRVIQGGSRQYVEPLTRGFRDRVRLSTPVVGVRRSVDDVELQFAGRDPERFDHVVFACHSDQALRILGTEATPLERELLGAFPYEPNLAVLHTDPTVLPRRRRAWASWNYRVPAESTGKATVTYNMNILQGLRAPSVFCVTLNDDRSINEKCVLGRFQYHHPIFTVARARAQERHHELIGPNRTSFCGAYWRNGFHEDGVVSGLRVSDYLLCQEPTWKAASTKAGSDIDASRRLSTVSSTVSA